MQHREEGEEYVRALIITPTRELAIQIQNHLDIVNHNSQTKVKVKFKKIYFSIRLLML